MHAYLICKPLSSASGRTNTALKRMDPGLTTAAFGTKAQTAISTKNADLSHNMSSGTDKLTVTDQSGRKHTIATKRSTTTVTRTIPGSSGGSSRSSRETTPTRTGLSATVRTEPLRHTLVRQSSPKTKTTLPPRSKTPSRALSPTGENKKTPRGTASSKNNIATSTVILASVPVPTVFSRVLLRFANMRDINYAWAISLFSARSPTHN